MERFTRLPAGRLEQIEKLEQLRALESGAAIAVGLRPMIRAWAWIPLEDAEKF
ncbi:MAG: hypothetical protein IPL39_13725 [Opitutaceae bacterium]|nr:hypothetical protein [Opitutaceae bacterium]